MSPTSRASTSPTSRSCGAACGRGGPTTRLVQKRTRRPASADTQGRGRGPRFLNRLGDTAMATQRSLSKSDVLEAIGNMSVFELAELIEAFKEKFGVTITAPAAAAPAAGGAGAAGGAAAPAAEEQTEFTVILKSGGEKKNPGIKEIRAVPSPWPREANDPAERAPRTA